MIDYVIVPGNFHKNYIRSLNFKKKIFITNSVGIIKPFPKKKFGLKRKKLEIVYIGRISREKNLELLFKLVKLSSNLVLSVYGKDEEKIAKKLKIEA